MVATIANAMTNVSLVNNNTGFSVWKRDGTGGTPSAISEADVYLQGTGACSVKVSNQGVVLAYGTGGLNLSAANTHVYIWVNMLAGGLMTARASNGLCVCLSSDATLSSGSNYSFWAVDGSDTYPGGWVRYVLDVSKTRTTGAGTLNLSSVQHIGMYCDTRPNVAKFDNLVIDRIDYTTGAGLRVYGTSTTDDCFGDIIAADEGNVSNKYGIVTTKGGVAYLRGRIEFGDDVGTNASTLTDTGRIIVFENPLYYDGTSVVSTISSTLYRLDFKGNGTGSTSITWGKKVGTGDTASGRNGLTIVSAGPTVSVDFDDGQVTNAYIYGTTFRDLIGTLSWGTNTAHECIGNTFNGCAQFDPVGGVVIRDCIFSNLYENPADSPVINDAALLWNSSIDIKNSSFIANSHANFNVAHGIEHATIISVATGSATSADAGGTTLTDTGASFLTTVAVNEYVFNETDGSYARITSVDSNSQVTHEVLSGGSENDWDISDNYSISPAVTYQDLTFSGNEVDILNSATGNDALFISKAGTSNPATFTGNGVSIGSVTVSITVNDQANSPIQNAQTSVFLTDGTAVLNADTNASGIASTSYAGSTPANVVIRVRKSSTGTTRYENYSTTAIIASGTGLTATVVLREDTIATA